MPPREKKRLEEVLERLAESPSDEEAWRDLYTQMWPRVFGTIYRLLRGNRDAAEDASQEVFLRLVRYCSFSELRNPDAFRAYLWAVCKNVARTYIQRTTQKPDSTSKVTSRTDMELESVQLASAEQGLRLKELMSAALSQLDEKDQQLVTLVLEGYSLSEIADILGLSYPNTGTRLHRIRTRLRSYLAKDR